MRGEMGYAEAESAGASAVLSLPRVGRIVRRSARPAPQDVSSRGRPRPARLVCRVGTQRSTDAEIYCPARRRSFRKGASPRKGKTAHCAQANG